MPSLQALPSTAICYSCAAPRGCAQTVLSKFAKSSLFQLLAKFKFITRFLSQSVVLNLAKGLSSFHLKSLLPTTSYSLLPREVGILS